MEEKKKLEEKYFEELKNKIIYNCFPKFQIYELQIYKELEEKEYAIFTAPKIEFKKNCRPDYLRLETKKYLSYFYSDFKVKEITECYQGDEFVYGEIVDVFFRWN